MYLCSRQPVVTSVVVYTEISDCQRLFAPGAPPPQSGAPEFHTRRVCSSESMYFLGNNTTAALGGRPSSRAPSLGHARTKCYALVPNSPICRKNDDVYVKNTLMSYSHYRLNICFK